MVPAVASVCSHCFTYRWRLTGHALIASSGIQLISLITSVAPARAFNWFGGNKPPGGGDGSGGGGGSQALMAPAKTQEPVVLTLASFAVTKLAYVRLTKMFREQYQAQTGVDVRFRLTFAGSGVQVCVEGAGGTVQGGM